MNHHQPWYMEDEPWRLVQTDDPLERPVYFETIFSQSNGYMGVRGYTELPLRRNRSVREAYLAGVFSEVGPQASRIIGQFPWPVVQMVSLPDPFGVEIDLDGEAMDLEAGRMLDFQRALDLRTGLLEMRARWRSPAGRVTHLACERFLSIDNPHLATQRISITPEGWSGRARLKFEIDGRTPSYFRCGDKRQPESPQDHFERHDVRLGETAGVLGMTTRQTGHRLAFAAEIDSTGERTQQAEDEARFSQTVTLDLSDGEAGVASRFVAVTCSRDAEVSGDPADSALAMLREATDRGFDSTLASSCTRWKALWDRADVQIDGDAKDQKVLRYNIFQLLQMAPYHSDRLSLPARGYAFNRYRGLYFWDTEIFLLPFYQWTLPAVARNLLSFRYHTLGGARHNAWHWGGSGALFPWMTESDTGLDNSIDARVWKLFHQTADIAYALDQYAQSSGDTTFMVERGLEILLETARFFASRFVRHEGPPWHLERTIGPDEDHGPGLDNGFTNLMARHNLRLALAWLDRLEASHPDDVAALRERVGLGETELDRWRDMAERIAIPTVPETDIPLQDEYLLNKKPIDVIGLGLRADPEKATLPDGGKRGDYQLIKQADIVLAMWLLMDQFTPEQVAAAYDFYEPMTLHISSLSWNTHALVAARLGRREQAYEYYLNSAGLDLDDVKGATQDGLHAAALGGCWQAVVLGFAGLNHRDGQPTCDPQLPPHWQAIRFTVHCGGQGYRVEARQDGAWSAARIDRDEADPAAGNA